MRRRVTIAHLLFLSIHIFVIIDFWRTKSITDHITKVTQKVVYSTDRSTSQAHALTLYELCMQHYSFTIPEKYASVLKTDAAVTIHATFFLHIVHSIEIEKYSIPISFGLYAVISLAVAIISVMALAFSKHFDFHSLAAIINGLLTLMVIYLIWF